MSLKSFRIVWYPRRGVKAHGLSLSPQVVNTLTGDFEWFVLLVVPLWTRNSRSGYQQPGYETAAYLSLNYLTSISLQMLFEVDFLFFFVKYMVMVVIYYICSFNFAVLVCPDFRI